MEADQKVYIERIISSLRDHYQIPGLSVAVVKDGVDVLTKGYGLSHMSQGVPDVDENTRFNIGSITKSFTAVVLANILQHRKDITWDTPLVQIFGPSFKFADEFRTQRASLRDLLAHKMGFELGETDFGWLCEGFDRNDLRVKAHAFSTHGDFRTKLMYNNFMYTLAGLAAEELSGQSWEELVDSTIFKLLGMENASFMDKMTESSIVMPHLAVSKSPEPIPIDVHKSAHCVAPAASICCSACDMAKWMKFLLSDGSICGMPIIKKHFLQECWKPQFALPLGTPYWSGFAQRPAFPITESRESYGFGFYLGTYRGFRYAAHAGELFGYDALMTLFLDCGIGIYSACNGPGGRAAFLSHQLIHYAISDIMLGEEPWLTEDTVKTFPEPWLPDSQFVFPVGQMQTDVEKNIPPTLPFDTYCGVYTHELLGAVMIGISCNSNALSMTYGQSGTFELYPDGEEHEFRIKGCGVMEFVHKVDLFAPSNWMMVKFQVSSKECKPVVEALVCSLFESSPIFCRTS